MRLCLHKSSLWRNIELLRDSIDAGVNKYLDGTQQMQIHRMKVKGGGERTNVERSSSNGVLERISLTFR